MTVYRVLELFCGTKSIGKYCAKHAYMFHVVNLDVDPKCKPTHVSDILKWDFRATYAPGDFDIIWASPPCTHYSVLRTTGGPRDIEGANAIVQRTLEIIQYFRPGVWFMENPATGYLKAQPFMLDMPYVDVHYCKYGYPYRKWTRIWTNVKGFVPKHCNMDCDSLIRNIATGQLRHQSTFGGIYPGVPLHQRYSIPPTLVEELIDAACKTLVIKSMNKLPEVQEHMPVGGKRIPIRIRSVSTENPSITEEFSSISEAAKSIADQCSQNNVRAALTRCITKREPLAGRIWTSMDNHNDTNVVVGGGEAKVPPPPAPYQPPQTANRIMVPKPKKIDLPAAPSTSQNSSSPDMRILELELQKEQAALKAKQVELLMVYLQTVGATQDPSIHTLVKQYLI